MILADIGPVLPYVLGALAGFVPGVAVGRVDWNQRVSYWQQVAMFSRRPLPPPPAPMTVASPVRREPATTKAEPRAEAA